MCVYKIVGEGLVTSGKNCIYLRKEENEQVVTTSSLSKVIGRQAAADYCRSVEVNTLHVTNCYTEVWNTQNY